MRRISGGGEEVVVCEVLEGLVVALGVPEEGGHDEAVVVRDEEEVVRDEEDLDEARAVVVRDEEDLDEARAVVVGGGDQVVVDCASSSLLLSCVLITMTVELWRWCHWPSCCQRHRRKQPRKQSPHNNLGNHNPRFPTP